jgi:hypothetical protein
MPRDPLADALEGSHHGSPYGGSEAHTVLKRLIETASPDVVADAMEHFLRRLALLEDFLEAQNLEVDGEQLEQFRSQHLPRLDKATAQLAQMLHGHVARREGG